MIYFKLYLWRSRRWWSSICTNWKKHLSVHPALACQARNTNGQQVFIMLHATTHHRYNPRGWKASSCRQSMHDRYNPGQRTWWTHGRANVTGTQKRRLCLANGDKGFPHSSHVATPSTINSFQTMCWLEMITVQTQHPFLSGRPHYLKLFENSFTKKFLLFSLSSLRVTGLHPCLLVACLTLCNTRTRAREVWKQHKSSLHIIYLFTTMTCKL